MFWAQLGLWSDEAAALAHDAGLDVVMNRCLKIEHARFHGGLHLAGFDTGVISSRRPADRSASSPSDPAGGRSLLLLRHAKSAWPDGVADLERPLARRGERAAELVGRFLADHGLVPDRVVSSPARRAAETAERVAGRARRGSGGGPPVVTAAGALSVELDRRLYDGDALARCSTTSPGRPVCWPSATSPTWSTWCAPCRGAEVRMPTAGLVWLDVPDAAGAGASSVPSATVRLVLPPKLLDAGRRERLRLGGAPGARLAADRAP